MDDLTRTVLRLADRDLAINLTQELVQTPSVVGEEGPIGAVIARQMQDVGLQNVRKQEVAPDRYNVIGEADFGPGPEIVLTGHMDTKPVCVGWDQDPYAGSLVSDRLYGHAIMDMKAGVAGQIAAASALTIGALPLKGRVVVAAVCDHMGEQMGSRAYFADSKADMAVLGELTDNRVAIGHRGRYYWDITTIGRSAHTCHKHEAINAVALAAEVVLEIEKIDHRPPLDDTVRDLFGEELFMAAGRIYGGLPPGGPSMIPDSCVIRVDSRPQPGVEAEAVRAVIEEAIGRAAARNVELRWEMVLADSKPGHLVGLDAPVVRYLRRASEIVHGESDVVGMSWLGDTSTFGPWVSTAIFGPGGEPVYTPNECLELRDIEVATKVYALTAAFALSQHLEVTG